MDRQEAEGPDLHNLSRDSGLSHSPELRLSIGSPIRHLGPGGGPPPGRPADAPSPAPSSGRERRWSLGGIFRRRERGGREVRSRGVSTGAGPPPLPPKNSNVFQPSLDVRGEGAVGVLPIFPHLRPDLQYPEGGGGRQEPGYYYDPRFGYVRAGSYYDQQIALMTGVAPDRLSRVSRDSGMSQGSQGRSSGLHSHGRASSSSSLETARSGQGSPTSQGSGGRSRAARTQRYLQRQGSRGAASEQELALVPAQSPARGPSIHTAAPRSLSLGPPPPPPRDPRRRSYLLPGEARPLSCSFEGGPASPTPRAPPLPPRLPPSYSAHQLHWVHSPLPAGPPPQRGAVLTPSPLPPPLDPSSLAYVDPSPRSRRPLQLRPSPCPSPCPSPSPRPSPCPPPPGPARPALPPYLEPPSGKSTPSSVTSKDSGCSESSSSHPIEPVSRSEGSPKSEEDTEEEEVGPREDFYLTRPPSAMEEQLRKEQFQPVVEQLNTSCPELGARTEPTNCKRRSHFEAALSELEAVCSNMEQDEDLLDRAERRDLPTAHQLLWRARDDAETDTSGEVTFSDLDTVLNWNTSSSFECMLDPARPRTPCSRRAGVADKVSDDMAVRRVSRPGKVPVPASCSAALHGQSYLLLSPVLSPAGSFALLEDSSNSDEPDPRTDDLLFRNIRDANLSGSAEPQPRFGIPAPGLGPPGAGAASDYLHAVPEGKYRSTFHPMRNPDVVKDDLARRGLRKDGNLGDPETLGIMRDPHGTIQPARVWPPDPSTQREREAKGPVVFYPNRHNPAMQSLSANIAQIIRKQSCRPGAEEADLVSYEEDLLVQDCMRAAREACREKKAGGKFKRSPRAGRRRGRWQGKTLFDLLRGEDRQAVSEPECLGPSLGDSEEELSEDEGVESVLSDPSPPPPALPARLPHVVTDNLPPATGPADKELGDKQDLVPEMDGLEAEHPGLQLEHLYLEQDPQRSKQEPEDQPRPEPTLSSEPTLALPFTLPSSISRILSSGLAQDPLHPEAVRGPGEGRQAAEESRLTVQLCLLDPPALGDLLGDKAARAKPSYLASLVEDWRPRDHSKTLSDGAEWEEQEGGQGPLDLLEEGKLSGEPRVVELLSHPAVCLLALCLACVECLPSWLDWPAALALTLAWALSLLLQ